MNHFNFFENMQKGKQGNKMFLIVGIVAAGVLCMLLVLYGSAQLEYKVVKSQLSYLESVENDTRFQKQYSQEKNLQSMISKAEGDIIFINTVDLVSEKAATVDEETLEKIFSFFKDDAKIINIQISGKTVSLNGIAVSLDSLAKIQNKMSSDGMFKDVFISTMSHNSQNDSQEDGILGEAVSFSCKLTVNIVAEDNGGETK